MRDSALPLTSFAWLCGPMVFEQIEQLKKQYTDKYVQVDADTPELARFKGVTGQVKTVNMSGRALVQFDEYHLNIAWYDIAFDYLKVVDKPAPKAPESKAEKKANPAPTDKAKAPAATEAKKLSPLEMARQQGAGGTAAKAPAEKAPAAETPAAEKPAAGKKLSVAEMMAAARANKPAAPAAAKGPEAKAAPVPEKPAATAEPKAPGAVPAKADKSKMSVAEMLAAARSNKPAAAAPAAPAPPKAAAPAAAPEPIAAPPDDVPPTAVAPEPEPEVAAPAAAKPAAAGAVDKKTMSIADMVAWCKQHDTK